MEPRCHAFPTIWPIFFKPGTKNNLFPLSSFQTAFRQWWEKQLTQTSSAKREKDKKEKRQMERRDLRFFDFYCITSHTQIFFSLSKPWIYADLLFGFSTVLQSKRMLPWKNRNLLMRVNRTIILLFFNLVFKYLLLLLGSNEYRRWSFL